MMENFKKVLSIFLAFAMVLTIMPVTAYAAVDATGKPTDLNNTLVVSIYTPDGSFPGEPAMHGSDDYISFNSKFAKTSASGKFKDNATTELNEGVLNDLVQGASSGNNTVWGVFSADGLKEKYFQSGASIIQPENEVKIIREIKKNDVNGMTDAEVLAKYEIVWYVIKLQHSPGNGWWSKATTEWHIDGLIREKIERTITINYYGNGNTEGSAPDGVTNHIVGDEYMILGSPNMKKKINGVYVDFLGWSAKADGTGAEAGFYQPGDLINPKESLSLYAMWDTTTQHTATVNTYLDGVLTSDAKIHGVDRKLSLSTDGQHFYDLTESSTGVYTVKITGNGKFHLYSKNDDGTYTQISAYQLTIYNQNGSLDIHHYSVKYDPNGGSFATAPGKQVYYYGDSVTAITEIPVKEGYRFLGWKDQNGNMVNPGAEVTASIKEAITLTAQWEKTVNVTVNVTINHAGGSGYDQMDTKDDLFLSLVSKADNQSPYLETGDTLTLNNKNYSGFRHSEIDKVTKYTAERPTFTDMPGGTAQYTVVTSKSGYDTSIKAAQDADGNWTIDVELTYNPTNFDLNFTVEVDKDVPDKYVPTAAIVKVTFWSTDRNRWEIITQQEGGAPGVRVDIDPATRLGSGSYPVWKYESNGSVPYGYRVQVTAFVYPDGTIVPTSDVTANVAWGDQVYTATLNEVEDGQKYGTLNGAYFADASDAQIGTLHTVITMDLHDVTFDAMGGQVNGQATQLVEDQYKVPFFKDYVPTREGGYLFAGWYKDAAYTTPATEGEDLTKDITLYAKWIDPLTISGTVTISGTYLQNGETVKVNDIDRAKVVMVVLREVRDGAVYDVDSIMLDFGTYDKNGIADYSFTGIPNDGKNYQIHVLVLNYNTTYDNEQDAGTSYSANEYSAVFGGDNLADVDAYLEFVAPSYDQRLEVDATQIGTNYRPNNVLSEVMYRDTGDNHPYYRISQHNVAPYGVLIGLTNGLGSGVQSVWKWHTDGTLYEYQMNITKVDDVVFNSDTAPFYIIYAAPAYWDSETNAPSAAMKATLIPKQYKVVFNLNAGEDTILGMDAFLQQDGSYETLHTWSFDTEINAVPTRYGYTFAGWEVDVAGAYSDGKIGADVHQDVVLTAKWEIICTNTVVTVANPTAGGVTSGDGEYDYGTSVTVKATAKGYYEFAGWYENGVLVSEDAEYTFTVLSDRVLTAKFALEAYKVETLVDPEGAGTVEGAGNYDKGTSATIKATAKLGYRFLGWYENGKLVSNDAEYTFTVTNNRVFTAKFSEKNYTVDALVLPSDGGTVTGAGTYQEGTEIILKAEVNEGYTFAGWFAENGELITEELELSHTVMADITFTARYRAVSTYDNSYAYIFGYTDSIMGAEGPLLRAEAAAMVHRLAKQNGQLGGFVYDPANPSFSDIAGEWFQSGIEYIHYRGGFSAEEGATVSPYAQITRGEAFKIIALGLAFTEETDLTYDEYGAILANRGYVIGIGESIFEDTDSLITRAEFCVMYNGIIGRSNALLEDAEGNKISAETYGFTDLDPTAWYYEDVLRATSAYDKNGFVDLKKRGERNELDDFA